MYRLVCSGGNYKVEAKAKTPSVRGLNMVYFFKGERNMTVEILIAKLKGSREDLRKATEACLQATQNLEAKNKAIAEAQVEVKTEILNKEQALDALRKDIEPKTTKESELSRVLILQKAELLSCEKALASHTKTNTEQQALVQKLTLAKTEQDTKFSAADTAKLQQSIDAYNSSLWRYVPYATSPPIDPRATATKDLEAAKLQEQEAAKLVQQTTDAIAVKKVELTKTEGAHATISGEIKDLRTKEATLTKEITLLKACVENIKVEDLKSKAEPAATPDTEAAKQTAANDATAVLPRPETAEGAPSVMATTSSPIVVIGFDQRRKSDPAPSTVSASKSYNATNL